MPHFRCTSLYSGVSFYWHGWTLISGWISNYTHYKVCGGISINSQTSTVQLLVFGMDKSFHSTLCWIYHYFSMLRLKSIHVIKRAPGVFCVNGSSDTLLKVSKHKYDIQSQTKVTFVMLNCIPMLNFKMAGYLTFLYLWWKHRTILCLSITVSV